mmetsp:Transcript_70645/g.133261  ORF Transcript_70645/g.133261 Transcript_70645/m.133261 type:complete len:221 (-) Transcript_70645:595-1257(-)
MIESPSCHKGLVIWEGLVVHALAANGEGIKGLNHRLYTRPLVCENQSGCVHGIFSINLIEHSLWCRGVPNYPQVHIHKKRIRGQPRLESLGWHDILPHDVCLPQHTLRQLNAKACRTVIINQADAFVLKVQSELMIMHHFLQSLFCLFTRLIAFVKYCSPCCGRRYLDLWFVTILADLHERHIAREDSLPGSPALHIGLFTNALPRQHLGYRIPARGPEN